MTDVTIIILAVIIGTLGAIVYSLRILVLLERRMARIELHIDNIAHKVLMEESRIERQIGVRKKKQ